MQKFWAQGWWFSGLGPQDLQNRFWVQTQGCAGESPASPLPLSLTWGYQRLVSQVCCCAPNFFLKCWAKPACFLSAWFCGFVLLQWKYAGLQQKFGQAYGANTGALCRRIRAGELHIHKSLLGYRRRLHISDELLPSMPTTFSYTGTRRPLRPQPSHHLAPVQGGWFANLPRWLLVLRQAFAKFFHRQRRRLLWGAKSVFCLSVSLTRTMCFKLPSFLNPKILKNQNPVPSFFLNPKILETQKPTSKLLVKPYNSGNPKTHFHASS